MIRNRQECRLSENHLEELMQKAVGEGNFQLTTDKHGVEAYGIADH